MRIGFIIHRKTFLKVLGPLIKESIERGHEVVFLYTFGDADSEKSYQNVDAEYLSSIFGPDCEYIAFAANSLSNAGLAAGLNVLITLEGYYHATSQGYLHELEALKKEGVKLVSLSHFFEFMLRPLEALYFFDQSIYLSEFQIDLHFQLLGDENSELRKEYSSKYTALGSPMFDLINTKNARGLREKFRIPQRKKVVLLMSPILTPATPWRHRVWREPSKIKRTIHSIKNREFNDLQEIWTGSTFKDCVKAIRSFCDHEDALLVVKSRGKHTDPDYLIEAADLFIAGKDDDFFPHFTTYELLSITDVCVTAMSMTALEASVAQIPVVNIYVPHLDFDEHVSQNYLDYIDSLMHGKAFSLMNAPECVNMVKYDDFPKWLNKQSLESIPWNLNKNKKYTEHFLGLQKQSSSERILAQIESITLNKEAAPPIRRSL